MQGKRKQGSGQPNGSTSIVDPVDRPHGKGVARDDAPEPAGDGARPSRRRPKPNPTSVSPDIPVSAAHGIWSAKDNRFYTPGITREVAPVGVVFAPPPPPLEPRPRATRKARDPRDPRGSVTYLRSPI
jgi:hypothetical protein